VTIKTNALLAGVAAIALTLGAPALAQNTGANEEQATGTGQQMQQSGAAADSAAGGVTAPAGQNLLIVTVGGAEIREADVMAALQSLPPQARQQPPQVLVPAVVNQLILRELVLEEARDEGLEEDPEVTALAGGVGGGDEALEQALVQIWFQRELDDRVGEDDIAAAYEDMQEANPDMQQPLADVRPQIETMLQREAAAAVGAELREDAEITFYDEAGNPVEQTQEESGMNADGEEQGEDQPQQ